MSSQTSSDNSSSVEDFLDPVEELIFRGLEAYDGDLGRAETELCREHPEHEGLIRKRLALVRAHEMQSEAAHEERPFPEKLGGFRLLRQLGGGGMGVVYLAVQESLGREVALKLIRPEQLYFAGTRERFRREVEAVGKLQHEGIVPVYTVGEEDGIPFLAMERVKGCTLGEVLQMLAQRDASKLTGADLLAAIRERVGAEDAPAGNLFDGSWVETCFRLAHRIATALEHAHSAGILHRDVKPSNVMVTATGRVMLLDFGLAHTEGQSRMTLAGSTIGSVPYLAPEQIAGHNGEPSARVDVYALGVTLYELLTLRPPYWSESGEGTRRQILRGEPEPVRNRNRAVPWDAETVCLTAMDRDASRRYATASDLARDLDNVTGLRPIEARRPGLALRVRRWLQRHRTLSAVCTVAALALSIGAGLLWANHSAAQGQIRLRQDGLVTKALLSDWEDVLPVSLAEVKAADRWLQQADALLSRAGSHAADHAALQDRALPRNEAESAADRDRRERALAELARMESLQESREGVRDGWWVNVGNHPYHFLLEQTEADLERARAAPRARYTWHFADPDDADRFETLSALVPELGRLARAAARIEAQRHRAAAEARATLEAYRGEWAQVCRAVADPSVNARYGGLAIEPQRGLIPIGQDPRSGLFEFSHYQTGEVPQRDPRTGELVLTEQTGLVFVLIPGGWIPEGPVVEPFFLSKYEMTQGQWLRATARNPSRFRAGCAYRGQEITGLHPIEWVNWYECDGLLRRMGLELPSSGQWEYAARAGEGQVGATSTTVVGNIADETSRGWPGFDFERIGTIASWRDGHVFHAPVGRFPANAFGLHDVVGNLREWCSTVPAGTDGWPRYDIRSSSFRDGTVAAGLDHRPYTAAVEKDVGLGLRPARRLER